MLPPATQNGGSRHRQTRLNARIEDCERVAHRGGGDDPPSDHHDSCCAAAARALRRELCGRGKQTMRQHLITHAQNASEYTIAGFRVAKSDVSYHADAARLFVGALKSGNKRRGELGVQLPEDEFVSAARGRRPLLWIEERRHTRVSRGTQTRRRIAS